MNPIINFYLDDTNLKKTLGFTHRDFLNSDDEWIETCHGHIQWAFPLEVGSQYIADAPLLTPDVVSLFRGSSVLQERLSQSFDHMSDFYAFKWHGAGTTRYDHWITPGNHNFLRLTRMIRSLGMLEATTARLDFLFEHLERICLNPKHYAIIGSETHTYWKNAHVEAINTRK